MSAFVILFQYTEVKEVRKTHCYLCLLNTNYNPTPNPLAFVPTYPREIGIPESDPCLCSRDRFKLNHDDRNLVEGLGSEPNNNRSTSHVSDDLCVFVIERELQQLDFMAR